jgi:hypothetical protein
MTMAAARQMARARWKATSKEQKTEVGRVLAEARKAIPPEQRSAIARKAAKARWGKK